MSLFDQVKARADAATTYPATVAEFKMKGDHATEPGAIVLRDFGPSRPHRYVTHLRVDFREAGRKPGYSSGHYFDDLKEAVGDYSDRKHRNLRYAA